MIASQLHERSRPALTTFDHSLPEDEREAVRERDLSKALTGNLIRFLRELGTGFAFVGAEVPIRSGDR